jgi:tetratricopeptide (TPR) repeat protein
MPPVRNSRYRQNAQQLDVIGLLRQIFRKLIARPSIERRGDSGRRKHARSASHRSPHAAAGRRAWLVKQEISIWRLTSLVCVLLALIWAGWRVFAQTAALNLTRSDPNAALSWLADEPAALNLLAAQELSKPEGNLDSAREWAENALRSSPLDARALTLLGLIAERKGDQASADALIQLSGARTWRDGPSQVWLFNREVRRGGYSDALQHADAMLRMGAPIELFPVLAAFTVHPRTFDALTAFLAKSPPWRTWFLSELSARLANQAPLVQLYAALSETEKPPTKVELRPYLNRLIKDGNFDQAYQVWQATLPPQQRAREIYPFNRDFDIPVDGQPFNWNLEPIPGAEIQIVSSVAGGSKRALLVQFSGARVTFANVKQLMLLPAGEYTFTGSVKSEDLLTSRGLWWRIFCADNPANSLVQTELVSGTLAWTDFAVKFEVPAADCRAQWLQLELPARVESEKRIEGEVWYQNLRITPVPATGAALVSGGANR